MGRMRSWVPWILVAMLGVAAIASASGGAANGPSLSTVSANSAAGRADFCREMRSVALVGQRIPGLINKTRSESERAAKTSLLVNLNVAERHFRSLGALQGLPSNIKAALDQLAVAVDRSETALRHARTKPQIRVAALMFTGAPTNVAVLSSYAPHECQDG